MLKAIAKLMSNTYRQPANQALHCVGAPFYATRLYMIIGHIADMQTNLLAGIAL